MGHATEEDGKKKVRSYRVTTDSTNYGSLYWAYFRLKYRVYVVGVVVGLFNVQMFAHTHSVNISLSVCV